MFSIKLGGLRQVVLLGPEYPKLFFKSGDDTLSFNDALKARRAQLVAHHRQPWLV